MKRRIAKLTLFAVVLFAILDVIACQVLDARMDRIDVPGVDRSAIETDTPWTVSYLHAGDPKAQRVIYVHGTPGSATAFEDYVRDPIPGFESISIDRPGFGATTPRKPALTLEEQSKIIESLLVERNGSWPILVGHSLGGPIVARVAADYPEKVGGIVILSGSLDPALEKIHWYQRVANFAFIPYLIPRTLRFSNQEVYPLKNELKILQPMLAGIACPIAIVHAPDDILVPYENVDFMKTQFPKELIAEVLVLEDKNHFIPWNAEQDVRAAIQRLAEWKPSTDEAPQSTH